MLLATWQTNVLLIKIRNDSWSSLNFMFCVALCIIIVLLYDIEYRFKTAKPSVVSCYKIMFSISLSDLSFVGILILSMYHSIWASMYPCIRVSWVSMYPCMIITVSECLCILVSQYLSVYVSLYNSLWVSMYPCITVSKCLCILVSKSLSVYVSLYDYYSIWVSMYPCIAVS